MGNSKLIFPLYGTTTSKDFFYFFFHSWRYHGVSFEMRQGYFLVTGYSRQVVETSWNSWRETVFNCQFYKDGIGTCQILALIFANLPTDTAYL